MTDEISEIDRVVGEAAWRAATLVAGEAETSVDYHIAYLRHAPTLASFVKRDRLEDGESLFRTAKRAGATAGQSREWNNLGMHQNERLWWRAFAKTATAVRPLLEPPETQTSIPPPIGVERRRRADNAYQRYEPPGARTHEPDPCSPTSTASLTVTPPGATAVAAPKPYSPDVVMISRAELEAMLGKAKTDSGEPARAFDKQKFREEMATRRALARGASASDELRRRAFLDFPHADDDLMEGRPQAADDGAYVYDEITVKRAGAQGETIEETVKVGFKGGDDGE